MSDGLDARRIAVRALSFVVKRHRPLDAALQGNRDYAGLPAADRAFARALCATSLRRLGQAETVLNTYLSKPLAETSDEARWILVTGAVQLIWLDTPAHAAVSTAVQLAGERAESRKLKGLINAVLRKVAADGKTVAARTTARDNLPDWLKSSWRRAYGPARLGRIAETLMAAPPLDLTLRDPASIDEWAERLQARVMPNGSLRLETVGDVTALEGFDEGAWWAQDAAASLPAQILAAQPGEHVVDVCAAPGGKTLQLAATGARVTAIDNSDSRLDRLRENLDRTGLNAKIIVTDGRGWTPKNPVDAVLLDAPCSATGTLRRHPEAAWIKRESDITKLQSLQLALVKSAEKMLKPGGRLILCTCSLQPEEGEQLAATVLKQFKSLTTDPVDAEQIPGLETAITGEGWVRTTPADWTDQGGLDGFFIARFRKTG